VIKILRLANNMRHQYFSVKD